MKHINWYGERWDGSLIYAESKSEMAALVRRGFEMKPLYELSLEEIVFIQEKQWNSNT